MEVMLGLRLRHILFYLLLLLTVFALSDRLQYWKNHLSNRPEKDEKGFSHQTVPYQEKLLKKSFLGGDFFLQNKQYNTVDLASIQKSHIHFLIMAFGSMKELDHHYIQLKKNLQIAKNKSDVFCLKNKNPINRWLSAFHINKRDNTCRSALLYISLDPNDSPIDLQSKLNHRHLSNVMGLTGSKKNIQQLMDRYKINYQRHNWIYVFSITPPKKEKMGPSTIIQQRLISIVPAIK